MKNAHLRFGWLTYVKTTEKAVTNIRLRLDRFIGEVLPDPPRQAKAHLISVIGGDTQIAAVSAAISMGERFMVEGLGVPPIRVCLERPSCGRHWRRFTASQEFQIGPSGFCGNSKNAKRSFRCWGLDVILFLSKATKSNFFPGSVMACGVATFAFPNIAVQSTGRAWN